MPEDLLKEKYCQSWSFDEPEHGPAQYMVIDIRDGDQNLAVE
jgi:hypothetical protein